jgi:ATP-dependent DNA helicase RecG
LLFHPTPEKFVTGAYHCQAAGVPKPSFYYHASGFWVEFRKEIDLSELSLNKRQLDAIKFFKEQKKISASDYMKRYNISERTARYDLAELVGKNILAKLGDNKTTTYFFIPCKQKQKK